ncbi:MAG TPA: hypothetical protein VGO00_08760 [Kofleriaceae bacterium]|jgi:type IV secretory pathway VirB10-like protein|nr:hypothetical protein [Kofleriaceae bacterium]
MSTGSNAVLDLVREASTRRLETDPSDDVLFQSRDESPRDRWPRGTVNWSPPPPEPVTHPTAPVHKRSWWKIGALTIAAAAGVAAAMIGFASDKKVAPPWVPPPLPVIAAPVVAPVPPPADPPVAAPAVAPAEPTVAPPVEPTIAVDTPAAAEPRPAKAAAPTKWKRRVHAAKKRVAKPKDVATAATAAPAATTKSKPSVAPAAPARRASQAHDTENPL